MNAPEHPQERPQRRPGAFATIAVDLAHTIPIVVAGPLSTSVLLVAMPHRPVGDPYVRLDPGIAAPLIGIEHARSEPHTTCRHFQATSRPGTLTNIAAQPATLATL